ncbi:MAG: protein TolR [Steroidobacteraceae bacterium]|nr:protein TolR [Steroidobacteraceae bacterium]
MAAGKRQRRLMAEINVVPYIDVMLVLLIIFMITAPLLAEGIRVELPKAAAEPLDPQLLKDQKPIVLSIDAAGQYFLNYGIDQDAPADLAEIERRAAAVLRRAPDTTVLVRGDRRVDYGQVVDAMTALQAAGARKVGFVTEPPPIARQRAGSR